MVTVWRGSDLQIQPRVGALISYQILPFVSGSSEPVGVTRQPLEIVAICAYWVPGPLKTSEAVILTGCYPQAFSEEALRR